jgi:hypothetical protein
MLMKQPLTEKWQTRRKAGAQSEGSRGWDRLATEDNWKPRLVIVFRPVLISYLRDRGVR